MAVQNKAEEVDTLFKEIDQAYALASNDEEFDDNAFNETKKLYWQAEDINFKGQIKKSAIQDRHVMRKAKAQIVEVYSSF